MVDWARWVVGDVESSDDVLKLCVEGPVSDFEERWPDFIQQQLDPKFVSKTPCILNRKTPEKIYHVFLLGLMQSLRRKGWELSPESRAGNGFVDIRILHRRKREAVLIELKSSEKKRDMDKDVDMALKQIIDNNYRNQESLPNIFTLREYGIACFHLSSRVKGRYLERSSRSRWVEKRDPTTSFS